MVDGSRIPCIYVLAGTNGAGKSAIIGATFNARGGLYFNPDIEAQRIGKHDPTLTQEAANSAAWHEGKRLLQQAIAEGKNFAFETTLGGNTIPALLERALDEGMEVRVWYAGLSSPELHIARVHARVLRGGHPIPEADIRRRYETSRLNVIRLLPKVTELKVYDNSTDVDLKAGVPPELRLVLQWEHGRIANPEDLHSTPDWAKPIVAAAMQLVERKSKP